VSVEHASISQEVAAVIATCRTSLVARPGGSIWGRRPAAISPSSHLDEAPLTGVLSSHYRRSIYTDLWLTTAVDCGVYLKPMYRSFLQDCNLKELISCSVVTGHTNIAQPHRPFNLVAIAYQRIAIWELKLTYFPNIGRVKRCK